jgi:hypothetical protein
MSGFDPNTDPAFNGFMTWAIVLLSIAGIIYTAYKVVAF